MSKTLGIYIHIPFCRSKCDYCDFYSLAGREDRMDDYQKALAIQITEGAPLARGYTVNSIYIGGGTMIDASSSNGKVVKRSCTTAYWTRNFVCARRVF